MVMVSESVWNGSLARCGEFETSLQCDLSNETVIKEINHDSADLRPVNRSI